MRDGTSTDVLTIGPFTFRYFHDGDDPGTGKVVMTTESTYVASTAFGVSRDEWEAFVCATS